MLDTIALIILGVSLLTFVVSLYSTRKEPLLSERPTSLPTLGEGYADEIEEPPMPAETEMRSKPSSAPDVGPASAYPMPEAESVRRGTEKRKMMATPTSPTVQRKASLVYWERMCLEEEFDLIVSLHKPEIKIVAPHGASVHESETTYRLPTTGHVRIIPVCSGCNIAPAYRDIKVSEIQAETKATFKVMPLKEGEFDLEVEFQAVQLDGRLTPIGKESTKVTIQTRPIELKLGVLNISVGRRVPAFFSMVGSFFGLVSFVLARFGVNLNEEIVAWSATISTGLAGAFIILITLMLLIKGIKPLMNEIDIRLK